MGRKEATSSRKRHLTPPADQVQAKVACKSRPAHPDSSDELPVPSLCPLPQEEPAELELSTENICISSSEEVILYLNQLCV